MDKISINRRLIGEGEPPFIIAEMSANHNGSIDMAKQIIHEAKAAGADAVKIQTYKPDTITIDDNGLDFQITDGLWAGRTLFELYQEAHMPWEWHENLFDHARSNDILIFSSPFDNTAIDLLEDLGAPAYKIASFEAVDLKLIQYAASTKKPLLISTGMADDEEIEEAVEAAIEGGCTQLALLHCVSGYPAPPEDYNLRTITDMKERFGLVIGLSDHTIDNTTAIASVALGASIIEKHFTLDRNGGGPDDSFSLEPEELSALCRDAKAAWKAIGHVEYGKKSSEKSNVAFRRSLYYVKDMNRGDIVTSDMIRSVRPGYGLAPKYIDQIIGRTIKQDITKHNAVKWEHFDD